jgi:pantoate--beta-alanine ligase
MKVVRTIAELRAELEPVRLESSIGLVPTMGALHAGHVSLFTAARRECDCVVASVFVNPAQFSPQEDFARYPRDERRDQEVAAEAGVDFLFVPATDELYPRGYQTWVDVDRLSRTLEGEQRPGHFRGVATICLKLFNIVRPQRAYFGQKDAQQALVLRRMVADLDLDLDVELRVLPTVRDDDGLALSSRNAYLSPADRKLALTLPRALETGDRESARKLLADAGVETDYVDVLEDDGVRVLAGAIRVGSTRLIDNVLLEGGSE